MGDDLIDGIAKPDIMDALQRILKAKPLSTAPQASAMLKYIVEQRLAGADDKLKSYSIAVDALGRPASFDPQTDPSVRVLARSLRQSMIEYYNGEGRDDPVRIDIPSGRYVPHFSKSPVASVGEPKPERRKGRGWAALGLAAAVGLAAIGFGYSRFNTPDTPVAAAKPFDGPRILIQPFSYSTTAPLQKPAHDLAFGLSYELVTDMAQYPWLSVIRIPDESGGVESLATQASQSNPPDYVLTGRVTENGTDVFVSVTLQSFPELKIKFSRVFRQPLDGTDIEKLQYELSQKIVTVVGSEHGILTRLILTDPPAARDIDIASFRCFMQIYEYWEHPSDTLHLDLRNCLTQAVTRNPGYAEAWAALGYVYMDESRQSRNKRADGDAWMDADDAIRRSLELAPLSSFVLNAAMTLSIEKPEPDVAAFEKYGKQDLVLRPNNPFTLANFGTKLAINAGKWDEGLAYVARALELNPAPPEWYYFAPAYHAAMLDDDEAAFQSSKPLRSAQSISGNMLQAMAALRTGDSETVANALANLKARGITSGSEARHYVENRRYEPGLKDALLRQLDAVYSGAVVTGS